jgi:hypothetical protein
MSLIIINKLAVCTDEICMLGVGPVNEFYFLSLLLFYLCFKLCVFRLRMFENRDLRRSEGGENY